MIGVILGLLALLLVGAVVLVVGLVVVALVALLLLWVGLRAVRWAVRRVLP